MGLLTLVWRRAARHWQMLLTLGLGVVIATALLASAPVLVNTVVEFGLRRTLLSEDPLAGNLRLRAFDRLTETGFDEMDAAVTATVEAHLGPYLTEIVPTVGGRWLYPWGEAQIAADERLIIRFYGDDATLQERAELVSGEWPAAGDAWEGDTIRVVIGDDLAEAYALEPGDRLPLSATRDEGAPSLFLEVTGIARPADPDDRFWFGEFSPLRSLSDERWQAQYSALAPRAAFFPLSEALFGDTPDEATWYVVLDPKQFDTGDIPALRAATAALAEDFRAFSPSVTVDTRLPDVLAGFATQSAAVRAPLYFLTAEVVLLALYYVIMVASLSVRQVEREFAVLQSRGASRGQLFRLQAAEAALVALVAFIAGPLIGVGLVRALTAFGPLADVAEPGWGLTLPQLAWIAAAVGATACLIALLLPVGPAINRSIVSFQQEAARSSRPPLWQRAYLDVILLVIGLVLFWRLQYSGGLAGVSGQVDWLLLLAPVALLLGAGTILLRVFPLVLNGLAALAARGRGLPPALALWSSARNPTHAARLVLLLTLAIALGILTTGINATLDASETERARYAAGGDLRLVSAREISLSDVEDLAGSTTAINAASAAYRTDGSLTIGRDYLQFGVLGVEPATFGPITDYRADFADQPVQALLGRLADEQPASGGMALPGRPRSVGLWLWSAPDESDPQSFAIPQGGSMLDRAGLTVRLVSALGESFILPLEPQVTAGDDPSGQRYPADGWRFFQAPLPSLSSGSYPLRLDLVTIRNESRTMSEFPRQLPATVDLAIDAVTLIDTEGATTLLTDIEAGLAPRVVASSEPGVEERSPPLTRFGADQTRDGEGSLRLAHDFTPEETEALGFGPVPPPQASLPALAGGRFQDATGAAVGDTVNVTIDSRPVTLELVGRVDYFPTLYDDLEAGFLIIDRDSLLRTLNDGAERAKRSNEVVLAVDPAADPEAVEAAVAAVPGLSDVIEAETLRRAIKADPMGLGLRSVTLFGYALTALLSLVGFATYFYFSARQRESLYGVLRSIGLSPQQLYGALILEQVVLIVAGVAIGTLLGLLLNRITLPGLPITFGDRPPTPPFIARNDWAAVGRIYLTLTVAFLLCLGAATALLWRTKLHRVLRVGEE